jgi:hypothetical protein
MKRRTKILLVIVAGLLIIGGIFGATAAFADNPASSNTTPAANLLQKIADNYANITGQSLDATALQQAFDQAQVQIKSEQEKAFLDKLVADGVITQDQADQYQAWLDARPDVPQLNGPAQGFGQFFGPRGFGHFFRGFHFGQPDQTQPPATQSSSTSGL